jgi:SAM-dependent methyltransferase
MFGRLKNLFAGAWRVRDERSAVLLSSLGGAKFEQRAPAHANAIDIFSGRWATDLSDADPAWRGGDAKVLSGDPRVALAAKHLGVADRVDGMTILELGPLEGGHTYLLERSGAACILAIESNVEAYLKCLIMKETLGMARARFLLGDFCSYLRDATDRFDMVFCSGVLYHMEDPLALIRDIARVSDKCFVWTHYYDATRSAARMPLPAAASGYNATYYRAEYPDRALGTFWGGNKPVASWMTRDDIIGAFRHFGFDVIDIIAQEPDAKHGATVTFAARKSGA